MTQKHGYKIEVDNINEVSNDSQERKVSVSVKPRKAPTAFRTISEVADDLGVQQHVLRFWETKFTQVKPLKRGGGRRYYRPEDVQLLRKIHDLLYTEGYTIKGVQKLLKGQGKQQIISNDTEKRDDTPQEPIVLRATRPAVVPAPAQEEAEAAEELKKLSDQQRDLLSSMLDDLKALRSILKSEN